MSVQADTSDLMRRETHALIGSDKVEGTAVYRSSGEKIGTIARVMLEGYEVNITETQLTGAPKYSIRENWDWTTGTRPIDDYYKVQPGWVM
jgi:hypothetical protein